MPTAVCDYPEVPPSLNSTSGLGASGWQKRHRQKGEWEGKFAMAVMVAKVPRGCTRMTISAKLRFNSKRKRDPDNYGAFLSKALADALVKGGWLPDDTQDHYEFLGVEFEEEKGEPRTVLTIDYIEPT